MNHIASKNLGRALLALSIALIAPGIAYAQSEGDSVADYGAVGNGIHDDTPAFVAAIAAATPSHVPVTVPAGTFRLTAPLVLNGVDLCGAGQSSILQWPALGAGVSAITTQNSANGNTRVMIKDVQVQGPNNAQLGIRRGNGDGITWAGYATGYMNDVRVQGFDRGVVCNNLCGHIYLSQCRLTQNYYGLYFQRNSSDYSVTDSALDGNTFASIAMAANAGPDDVTMTSVHLGFGPYGIYQEPTPIQQGSCNFMVDWVMTHCRFEQIGNAAIETDATYSPSTSNVSSSFGVEITHCGMSWGPEYTIASLPHSYAVKFSSLGGTVHIISGESPFRPYPGSGQTQAYSIALNYASLFELDQTAATNALFSIGMGLQPTIN